MTDDIEHRLLKRARKGNQDAFAIIKSLTEPALRRFIWRILGGSSHADDILQDVYMALYMNLEKMDPPEKMRPFLFRVARNRCYDHLRRSNHRNHLCFDDMAYTLHTENETSPETKVSLSMALDEVERAMRQLPTHQREALVLLTQEELNYAEIAEITGVSIGTVKSRVFHARQTLRRLLKQ